MARVPSHTPPSNKRRPSGANAPAASLNEAGQGQEAEAASGGGALPSDVYASLAHLARMSDRDHPMVFAGRDREFELLDAAIYGAQRGGVGRTVVVQGVPGAGKTSLLNEQANRLSAREQEGQPPVIPVPLRPNDLDAPPAAIIEEIDRQYREFAMVDERSARLDSAVNSTMLAARTLFASFTKRDFSEFRPSARAPASLPIALDEYVSFRVGRKGSTIVLLVDEAQNLEDTQHVRRHLDALHGGIRGNTHMLLACFGLANTVARLGTLGLSRLANGHVRTIGPLSNKDARRVVIDTLDVALAAYAFGAGSSDDAERKQWIGKAAGAILDESANFPHHLANGCRGFAEIVLNEGVATEPPVEALRRKCAGYRTDYYNTRLLPWAPHTIALSLAFGASDDEWVPATDLARSLMASDNRGLPVDQATAVKVMDELRDNGYIEERNGLCRAAVPSLKSHFKATLGDLRSDNQAARLVLGALPPRRGSQTHGPA